MMTLLWMAVLIVLSGTLSATETAVFSIRPAERRRLVKTHRTLQVALARPLDLLVTLLLANLLVNVAFLSLGSRASLDLLQAGRPLASIAVVAAALAAIILLGEILPKTLALAAPGGLLTAISPVLVILRWVLRPAVFLGVTATRLVSAPLLRGQVLASVGREEFRSAVAWRAGTGTYRPVEAALLHDVIAFAELRARDVMVPRVDVVFLDSQDDRQRWIEILAEHPHAEYPVCDDSPDRMLGTVRATAVLDHGPWNLEEHLEEPLYAPANMSAERLVQRLIDEDRRLAVLLDEHGGLVGVVGLGTLLQSVLGEIETQPDAPKHGLVRRNSGALVVPGRCPLHVLREEAGVDLPARGSGSVGGAVAEQLGHVPRAGDEIVVAGWRVRVVDVRRRRVETVVIRPIGAVEP